MPGFKSVQVYGSQDIYFNKLKPGRSIVNLT